MVGHVVENITQLIGKTPVVRLRKLNDKGSAEVLLKLESFNPGGSIKDRIALNMIEEAEKTGKLRKNSLIVEPTSGNTGVGLAMVAAAKGYKLILTMPDTMSIERRALLKSYGADLVLTPGNDGMPGAIAKAKEIATENEDAFMPQQFENPANPDAHRKATAKEILSQVDGRLDAFVAAIGTGGTITGTGEILKSAIPDLTVVGVEPAGSPVLSGGSPGPHRIQGTGAGFIPKVLNVSICDKIVRVSDEDAYSTTRRLAEEEGILSGISTGANVKAALDIASELGDGRRVLTIACDTGERYLSIDGLFL